MEKINELRNQFKKYDLDGYLVPKNDEFFSEYVPVQRDYLQYISNFTGSYGLALILKKNGVCLSKVTIVSTVPGGFKVIPFVELQKGETFPSSGSCGYYHHHKDF